MPEVERPLDVTIICISNCIFSLLLILFGVGLVIYGLLLSRGGELSSLLLPFFGIPLILFGIISFVITYLLWKMKKLGWWLLMLVVVIVVVISSLSILSVVLMNTTFRTFYLTGLVIGIVFIKRLWSIRNLFK